MSAPAPQAPRPPKPPKGHRQRGAGTTVTGKASVTRDGLVIKEWQRTPKQLILEWCKNQSRPLPRYVNAASKPGQVLVRIILADPKNKEKDITIVPREGFADAVQAEHAVALLALQRVDSQRNHEAKLPEPYRATWLKLVGRTGAAAEEEDGNEDDSEDENPFKCAQCGKAFAKEHGLEAHTKKEHPKPKGGEPAPASASAAATSTSSGYSFPAFSGSQEATDPASLSRLSTLPQALAAVSRQQQQQPGGPTAAASINLLNEASLSLTGLAAKSRYASEHEQRLAAEEQERLAALERRRAEEHAFREAEETCSVFMSAENRDIIEAIVKKVPSAGLVGSAPGSATANQAVVDELVEVHGFQPEDARLGASAGRDVAQALDWLCIHLPEDSLPAGGGFEMARFHVSSSKPAAAPGALSAPATPSVGTAGNGAGAAKEEVEPPPFEEDALVDWVVRYVDPSYTMPLPVLGGPAPRNEALEQEVKSLEAICGEAVTSSAGRSLFIVNFQLGSDVFGLGEAVLDIRLSPTGYPVSPHTIALVRNPRLPAALLAKVSVQLAARALDLVGEPLCFALYDYCKTLDIKALAKTELASLQSAIVTPNLPTRPPKLNAAPSSGVAASNAASSQTNNKRASKPAVMLRNQSDMEAQSAVLSARFAALKQKPAFRQVLQRRAALPAHGFKSQILSALDKNRVLLIAGATGCGKTTQVPQFILENAIEKGMGGFVSIVVCQPRRLAATSVAARVAVEMGEESVGDLVGYRVQLDNCAGVSTRLEFVTTGLLLRRLQSDPTLCNTTHVIVDEVHERSIDSDFLLACLKSISRPDLKIVMMSATMDHAKLAGYFSKPPVLEIPGFTHPVTELHLEELLAKVDYTPRGCSRTDDLQRKMQAIERVESLVDYDLLVRVVVHANDELTGQGDDKGSILVFLSGVAEISKAARMLKDAEGGRGLPMDIMPLHGALSNAEQKKVFEPCHKGRRKVILSTNVAETSVTIEDVVYVIDSGRVKETRFNPMSNLSSLVDTLISRASAKQRRGRAGRVRPGVCARLWSVSSKTMDDVQLPEVHRVPLEQTALQVLALGLGPVAKFLGGLVDAPRVEAVQHAVDSLFNIGAVTRDERTQEERLTPLGKHLSQLPVDVRVGKMLVYGSVLGCLDAVLTVAAAHSRRSPWLNVPLEKRGEADQARRIFRTQGLAAGALSDHLVMISAYNAWVAQGNERERRRFCEEHFLAHEGLREMSELRKDYLSALGKLGFGVGLVEGAPAASVDEERRTRQLVKAVLVAGLYPRVARVRRARLRFVETAGGAMPEEPEAKDLIFIDEAHNSRVFVHPSSVLFNQRSFTFPFVVYSEKVATSKTFIKDLTCVAPYGFLLFGGSVRVEHSSGMVFVDGKFKFRCGARIGVLIKELRSLLDALLEAKIVNPSMDVTSSDVVFAVKKLVEGDGLF